MIGVAILAAGESKRMGKNKLLLEVGGKRVIEWTVDSFRGIVDDIVVVLGHRPEDLIPALKELGVRWTVNKRYGEGMASSFKEGIRELRKCDAAFLALGDQPFVDKGFLKKATRVWRRRRAKVVSPVHEGKKGHPVLFDRSLFGEIFSLERHETIRDVIHRHADELHLVRAGKWSVMDMDTPEDFAELLSFRSQRQSA
ncbi:MAG: nucleotidyltransferase family protein [Candidatus Hodarchaeaceae archaeon]|nr:nucleotidyltransferase family protein [Candidatus Hodarchaeaceae archaeon]